MLLTILAVIPLVAGPPPSAPADEGAERPISWAAAVGGLTGALVGGGTAFALASDNLIVGGLAAPLVAVPSAAIGATLGSWLAGDGLLWQPAAGVLAGSVVAPMVGAGLVYVVSLAIGGQGGAIIFVVGAAAAIAVGAFAGSGIGPWLMLEWFPPTTGARQPVDDEPELELLPWVPVGCVGGAAMGVLLGGAGGYVVEQLLRAPDQRTGTPNVFAIALGAGLGGAILGVAGPFVAVPLGNRE